MKHALIAAVLALVCASAHATNNHPPGKPQVVAGAKSSSKSGAIAGSDSDALAQNIDYYDGGRSYALFNAMRAAPMPATTCPDHKNHIVSILFGVVAVDFSTAGTDHGCLDKILNAVYKVPLPPKLPTTGQIHPAGYVTAADRAVDDCAGPAPAAVQSVTGDPERQLRAGEPSSATRGSTRENGFRKATSPTRPARRTPKLQPVADVDGSGGCRK